jgi:hypothetical protein
MIVSDNTEEPDRGRTEGGKPQQYYLRPIRDIVDHHLGNVILGAIIIICLFLATSKTDVPYLKEFLFLIGGAFVGRFVKKE